MTTKSFLFVFFLIFLINSTISLNQSPIPRTVQEENDWLARNEVIQKEIKIKKELEAFTLALDSNYAYIPNATRALRNNNPGNLFGFYDGKYRSFNTMKEGYNSLIKDLTLKIDGRSAHTDSLTTMKEFVFIYSPPHENNSTKYVKYLCKAMGLKETDKLCDVKDVHRLAKIIIYMEDQNVYKSLYEDCKDFNILMRDNNVIYLASK